MKKILSFLRKTKLLIFYRYLLHKYFKVFKSNGESVIQLANTTYYNRHPEIFEFIKNKLLTKSPLILSFGCSTGEECVTLSNYLPNSNIIGVDVNKSNIIKAKTQNTKVNISYHHLDIMSGATFLKNNSIDAIFALSVLCLEPEARQLNNISNRFNFYNFQSILNRFDHLLKSGGYLIIKNSNYILEDTNLSDNYEAVYSGFSDFPLFNKRGEKKENSNKINWIYKKK